MERESKSILIPVIIGVVLMLVLAFFLPTQPIKRDTESKARQTEINLVYAYQNSQWNACMEEVIRRFEADHPDIDVQYEIRYEDRVYDDVLNKLAARNELGDIVQIKEPYAWAESGLLAPLPEELASKVGTTCTVNGQTYGVCALGTTTGVVYNKELFAQFDLSVPKTYEEFLNLCEVLKRSGVTPLGVSGKDLWHFEYWMNHFLRADVLTVEPDFLALCNTGARDWNDPLIGTMLSHLNELFQKGYVAETWPATPDAALAFHMAEQEVAMVFSGPWLAADALMLDPNLQLGWFYVPNTAGTVIAGENLDVFWTVTEGCAQDEKRYEAAVAFLTYFYSENVYNWIYTSMMGYSTLADGGSYTGPAQGVQADVTLAHSKADMHFRAYVGDENTPPGFEKKLLTLLSQMCAGQLSVKEVQQAACQAWTECLGQEVAYER